MVLRKVRFPRSEDEHGRSGIKNKPGKPCDALEAHSERGPERTALEMNFVRAIIRIRCGKRAFEKAVTEQKYTCEGTTPSPLNKKKEIGGKYKSKWQTHFLPTIVVGILFERSKVTNELRKTKHGVTCNFWSVSAMIVQ